MLPLVTYVCHPALLQSGEKARMWAAQDFSENEVKKETFCARFKTAEHAQVFEDAFTAAVAASGSVSTYDKY